MAAGEPAGGPPPAEALAAMPTEVWTALLPPLRAALQTVADDALTPPLRRLRAAPAKRLVDRRVRRDLERALANGGALWVAFRELIRADPETAARWQAALTADGDGTQTQADDTVAAGPDATAELVARLKERARSLKRERDEIARQVDGANARAAAAEDARDAALDTVAELQSELDQLRAAWSSAKEGERDAAGRAERRRDREVADLQQQLRETRRLLEEERRQATETREALARANARTQQGSGAVTSTQPTEAVDGRPTRLPPDLVPGTTEHAKALLPRGRVVIVDGYNVTKTHRPDLDLGAQREWLVSLASGAAARMGLVLTIVFDGERGMGVGSQRSRGVQVEFSRGMTADDDICFLVAAADPATPITVVTDDAGLRERLAPDQVDLLFTREFLWATG